MTHTKKLRALMGFVGAFAILAYFAPAAHADIFLTLTDGTTTFSCSRTGGVGCTAGGFTAPVGTGGVPSQVTFTGNVGVFTVQFSITATSLQNPTLGSLNMNFQTVTTSDTTKNLSVYAVQTGYTLPPAGTTGVLDTSGSGTWTTALNSTRSVQSWIDLQNGNLGGNTLPAPGAPGADATNTCNVTVPTNDLSIGTSCNTAQVNIPGFNVPYSLSQLEVLHLSATSAILNNATGNTQVISVTSVPEPASMLLLGFGLVGLAAWGRKRLGKK